MSRFFINNFESVFSAGSDTFNWWITEHVEYTITIWTGDNWFGGTDANVFVQLYGQFGSSGALRLESSTSSFERGSKDVFKFRLLNLGM